jgi:hypothetical protein
VHLTGRHYRQPVSCIRHEDTLLTPEKATESSTWYKTSRSTDRDVPASAAGALRHYAGLLGPTGAVAGRVVVERDLPLRVGPAEGRRPVAADPYRADAGTGRWPRRAAALAGGEGAETAGPPGANVRPLAMATRDLDRPLMLGATPFPLPLPLGHDCVAKVIAVGGDVRYAGDRRSLQPFGRGIMTRYGAARTGHAHMLTGEQNGGSARVRTRDPNPHDLCVLRPRRPGVARALGLSACGASLVVQASPWSGTRGGRSRTGSGDPRSRHGATRTRCAG